MSKVTFLPRGERIRELRVGRALNQSELADKLGISKRTLEMVEKGKPCLPKTLHAVAQFFGLEMDTLCQAGHEASSDASRLAPTGRGRYDLLIWYDHRDRESVEEVTRLLVERGLRPWFDKWHLQVGQTWTQAVHDLLTDVPWVVNCIGRHEPPSLPNDCRVPPAIHAVLAGADPSQLSVDAEHVVDLRGANPLGLDRVQEVLATPLHAFSNDLCPYRGLDSFSVDHAQWMFGREADVGRLLEPLRRGDKLLFVVGPSGSGKSSTVLAGLVPELRAGGLDGYRDWDIVVMRPGTRPCNELSIALLRSRTKCDATTSALHDINTPPPLLERLGALRESILRDRNTLADMAALQTQHSRLLVVVDQFEELFMSDSSEHRSGSTRLDADAQAFIANILAATAPPRGSVVVIATLRADFVGACLSVPDLDERFAKAVNFALPPVEERALRDAIVRPAKLVGINVEEKVVADLIEGMRVQPGRLPLLQHALTELWQRRDRQGRLMTFDSYQSLGGIEGSIANKADSVLVKLTPDERAAARRAFRRLVYLSSETGDTRRTASRAEFADDPLTEKVLAELIDARLLTADQDSRGDNTIEIAHEVLIHANPTLRSWINEGREALCLQHEVTRSASLWHTLPESARRSTLWRGARLKRAVELWDKGEMDLSAFEIDFLRAGHRAQLRTVWLFYSVVVLIVLVLLGLAMWALNERDRADLQRVEFELQNDRIRTYAERVRIAAFNLAIRDAMNKGDHTMAVALLREPGLPAALEDWWSLAVSTIRHPVADTIYQSQANVAHSSAAVSEDGRRIATVSYDGNVYVWTRDGTDTPLVLRGHSGPVLSLAFGPRGDRLVTTSQDRTGRIWHLDGTKNALVLRGHADTVFAAAFSTDGSRVITGSLDDTARVWSAETGDELLTLTGHRADVRFVSVLSDNLGYVTGAQNGEFIVWGIDGKVESSIICLLEYPVGFAAVNESTNRVAVTTGGGKLIGRLKICNLNDTERAVLTAKGHDGQIQSLMFSRNGDRVLTGGIDNTARVWNINDGSETQRIITPDAVIAAMFLPTETAIAVVSARGNIRVFDAKISRDMMTIRGHAGIVRSAMFSSDGMQVITAGLDKTVRIWPRSPNHDAQSDIIRLPVFPLFAALAPTGGRLAVACSDGTIRLVNINGETTLLRGHNKEVRFIHFDPAGTHLVSASSDGTARLWNLQTGHELGSVPHLDVRSAEFSADGELIVTAGFDGTVRVWTKEGTLVRTMLHESAIYHATFSPSGRAIATASTDGILRVWDFDSNEVVQEYHGHSGPITSVDYSTDGKYIVSASWDGTARIWDIGSTDNLTLYQSDRILMFASFSPDGNHVVVADKDLAQVWPIQSRAAVYERLWRATTYCLSPSQRRTYLGESDSAAMRKAQCCRNGVLAVRAGRPASDVQCSSDVKSPGWMIQLSRERLDLEP